MATVLAATRRFLEEQRLNVLLTAYDDAPDRERKERIAEEIFELTAPAIRGIVASHAKGRLDADRAEYLAWEVLYRGLEGHGRTAFKLSDAPANDWSAPLRRLREQALGGVPLAVRLWSAIPEEARRAVEEGAGRIHVHLQHRTIAAINEALLERGLVPPEDLRRLSADPEQGELAGSGTEALDRSGLTFANAMAVHALLPELARPARRRPNLIGYIAGVVAPRMVPAVVAEEEGRPPDREGVLALGQLREDIDLERELRETDRLPEGWAALPRAERIRRLQLRRIRERYGERIAWWEEQLRRLGRPVRLGGGNAWDLAKRLFREHGVDPRLWAYPDSRFYLPRAAARPFGVERIGRALAMLHEGPASPESRRQEDIPARERPMELDAEVYRVLVEETYGKPGFAAELAVGRLLAGNPQPDLQQVQDWIATLPEDVRDDIQTAGFPSIAWSIDRRVRSELAEPEVREQLERTLGLGAGQLATAVRSIRGWIVVRAALGFPAKSWLQKSGQAEPSGPPEEDGPAAANIGVTASWQFREGTGWVCARAHVLAPHGISLGDLCKIIPAPPGWRVVGGDMAISSAFPPEHRTDDESAVLHSSPGRSIAAWHEREAGAAEPLANRPDTDA